MLLSVLSVNFNKKNYSSGRSNSFGNVTFTKSPEKIMEHLRTCHPGHLIKSHISFDEALRVYELLGYQLVPKRGSHAQLYKTGGKESITLLRPHGNEKSIAPYDIKTLKKEIDAYFSI